MAKSQTANLVARLIAKQLRYQISGKEWGRLHVILQRYGQATVHKAIDAMTKYTHGISYIPDVLEKTCQALASKEANPVINDIIEDILSK